MTETVEASSAVGASSSAAGETPARRRKAGGGLEGMLLPELKQLAGTLGIKGTGALRKGQLIEAIKAAQSGGGSAPATSRAKSSQPTLDEAVAEPVVAKAAKAETRAEARTEARAEARKNDGENTAGNSRRENGRTRGERAQAAATEAAPVEQARAEVAEPKTAESQVESGEAREGGQDRGEQTRGERSRNRDSQRTDSRRTEQRTAERTEQRTEGRAEGRGETQGAERGEAQRGGQDGRDRNQDRNRDAGRNTESRDRNQDNRDGGEDGDGRRRRRRGRDRDRNRDGGGAPQTGGRTERNERSRGGRNERYEQEPVVNEDDVLVPAAGILDVLDNYAFVRTSGYLPGPNDVYVALSMVKRYGLRKGDAITGAVKQPKDGERKEKFNPLVRIDTVNGSDPEAAKHRQDFNKLTPLYASERLRLETESNILVTRIVDIVSPIGKGQRGLIVSPPKAGKTMVLQALANAITTNNPEVHLMVVLVDERPEEVTDMQRTVKGEVIASTFDRPADDHTTVAELAIERAKRLVELGHDVVVLLDSITRLGRAYNIAAPASGRILSGGVDSSALYPPKRFFGAARNIEDGGSLTILATALIETGSKMDEVIFEEFKGTGNMELRLRREFADRRIFPAIDVVASGTRREELLMSKDETAVTWKLRRVLSALDGQAALELLIGKLKESKSNIEFLMQVNKTTPTSGNGGRSTDDGS
ncbi:transcription termination factor Rho [Kribbella sp. NBC_01245]|uniref:transcription termination factor Rho n=1 Tax=Kribbella sp. NBC_01245 TaxID=2903578 RepID=UPI002E2DBDBA|nr:transcription termination factor Rho [Kribbella sp. NBC_01245]